MQQTEHAKRVEALLIGVAERALESEGISLIQFLEDLGAPVMAALGGHPNLRATILQKTGAVTEQRIGLIVPVDAADAMLGAMLNEDIISSADIVDALSMKEWMSGIGVRKFWKIVNLFLIDGTPDDEPLVPFLQETVREELVTGDDIVLDSFYGEIVNRDPDMAMRVMRALDQACRDGLPDPRGVVLETAGAEIVVKMLPAADRVLLIRRVEEKLGLVPAPSSATNAETAGDAKQEAQASAPPDEETKDEGSAEPPTSDAPVIQTSDEITADDIEQIGGFDADDPKTNPPPAETEAPPPPVTVSKAPTQPGGLASRKASSPTSSAAPRPTATPPAGTGQTRVGHPLRATAPLGSALPPVSRRGPSPDGPKKP